MDIFAGFLAFDEELNEVSQALDEAMAHLLPPLLIKFHYNRIPHKTSYHTKFSELESDNELDPALPWREVQGIPSFQLREAMRNPQQPTENGSFSFQNTALPLNLIDNYDRDGL